MNKSDIDLSNPEARADHFKYTDGRPSDRSIIEEISGAVEFIRNDCTPKDTFISADLCGDLWKENPDHHFYIGQRIRMLVLEGKLPIERVGTTNKRALYRII